MNSAKLPDQISQGVALGWDAASSLLTLVTQRGRQRERAAYRVAEVRVDWPGRGFRLVKVVGCGDPDAESYTAFLSPAGALDACECRGFLRWRRPCKHLLALRSLAASGDLP